MFDALNAISSIFLLRHAIRLSIFLILVVTSSGLFLATTAFGEPVRSNSSIKVSDLLSVENVSGNVWVHTSFSMLANGQIFPANGLIVNSGDGILLIDTAWGVEPTRELLAWIDANLGAPVVAVLITHFHEDSLGGATVLEEAGIPFFSSQITHDLAPTVSLPQPEVIKGLETPGGATDFHGIEVFYPGSGHSIDNLVVWVPSEKVLFGTCAIRSPAFPGAGNIADASLEHWPKAIHAVRTRFPTVRVVVPGHGPAGTADLLDYTIALFESTGGTNE